VKALENGKIVRSLGAKLRFELLARKDTFLDQELGRSMGHCHVLTMSSSSETVCFCFVGHHCSIRSG
jgi:hypothetical protein